MVHPALGVRPTGLPYRPVGGRGGQQNSESANQSNVRSGVLGLKGSVRTGVRRGLQMIRG